MQTASQIIAAKRAAKRNAEIRREANKKIGNKTPTATNWHNTNPNKTPTYCAYNTANPTPKKTPPAKKSNTYCTIKP